jgi:hypothetical protein
MAWLSNAVMGMAMLIGQNPSTATPPASSSDAVAAAPVYSDSTSSSFLKGDTCFPRFIAPVTNPVFAKDPRSLTYARGLFIHNTMDSDHPFGGGDFQAAALQVGVAVNERLTIIADKDGYAWINPNAAPRTDGWLNLGAGLKYAFLRDVENQFILSGGFLYEIPSGGAAAFSGHGNGTFTVFSTFGKEWQENWHLLGTVGYQFPVDTNQNSSYFYTSLHLDYRLTPWFYPLVEMNWFHWVQGGERGIPPAVGEVDGLINLGTSGVAGNDFVTVAFGGRFVLSEHLSTGAAWEFPVSNRHDFMNNRVTVDVIFRY